MTEPEAKEKFGEDKVKIYKTSVSCLVLSPVKW
jgi:hypothetical protein